MLSQKIINAIGILIIAGVLLGAYGVQYIEHETPCPLCLLQRLGMIGVICSLLLNLTFGIHTTHYALAILSSLVGGVVALRQISLHVAPGGHPFGLPILGLSLYTWSFIVFACSILGVALLLFLYNNQKNLENDDSCKNFFAWTFAFVLLIAIANIITTFTLCGFGLC